MSPHAAMRKTEMKKTADTRLMHRRGDDDAHADGHGPEQHREREVFVLDDLLPQVVRRYLVENGEGRDKNENPHRGIQHRVQDIDGVKVVHITFLRYSEGN